MQFGYVEKRRFFLRKQIFPFSVLALELLYQSCIAFKLRFDCIDMFAHVCVCPRRKDVLRFEPIKRKMKREVNGIVAVKIGKMYM